MGEIGLTAEEAGSVGVASAALGVASALIIIGAIVSIIEGVLGLRAAKDNQKIMPVWVLAIIGLVGAVISLIMSIAQGAFNASSILSLALSGLMFWIANNIKTEAGK